MHCAECKNTLYCDARKVDSGISGCTSGEPFYLPQHVGKTVAETIIRATTLLNLPIDDYFNACFDVAKLEIQSFISKKQNGEDTDDI